MKYSFLLLILVANFAHADSAKPKFGPTATRLFLSHDYIKKNAAPDYWALSPYYTHQVYEWSCGVATTQMVVNAARASLNLTASDELATHKSLADKLNDSSQWVDSEKGHGVTLDTLATLLEKSLKNFGLSKASVTAIHADASEKFTKKLHEDLIQNEKSAKDFIVLNFLQSEFTGDPEGAVGHFAPVAAFDAKQKRVLVMDPDRKYYEPYWVSEETLIKGINTTDKAAGKTRGYLVVKTGE